MKRQKILFPFVRQRAIFSLVNCSIIVILMAIGVIMRLLGSARSESYLGTGAFRMFTVDSNVLVGLCAMLAIPYQVDAIRTGTTHMPRWLIYTLYTGVSAVTLTLMTTLFILTPGSGFDVTLYTGPNLYMHLLTPIMSILLFIFVVNDHKITFRYTLIPLLPVVVYAIVYAIMVFGVGEENGGWSDHYMFGTFIPWPLTLVLMIAFSFGLFTGLRVLHNLARKKQEAMFRNGYRKAMTENHLSAEEAVRVLAAESRRNDPYHADVVVPRQIIFAFKLYAPTEQSLDDLCGLYLQEYLKNIGE